MNEIVEEFEYRGYTVKIRHDTESESPLEWNEHVKLYAPHRKYKFGNVDYDAPEGTRVKVPVYLYDHSGLTVSTTPFSCRFDSGRLGTMFVENEDADEHSMAHIMGLFEVFSKYVSGEVYDFEISKNDEIIDQCGCYYGIDVVRDSARIAVDDHLLLLEKGRVAGVEAATQNGIVEAIQIARYA